MQLIVHVVVKDVLTMKIIETNMRPIGIGTPITEPPSHTTGHTDHVPRRFGVRINMAKVDILA